MIELSQLANSIETKLNYEVKNYLLEIFPNTSFLYNICLNSGEYKKPEVDEENPNCVTYYINAIMKVLSSEIEGDANYESTYSASMTTSIEFLIPFPERTYIANNNKSQKFGDTVHYMLSDILQAGTSEDMLDNSGEAYLVGSRFTVPSPGSKEIRSMIGESISLEIYGTHYFIAQGVNSNNIKLYLGKPDEKGELSADQLVYASHIGIARRSITEGNITSSSPSAKNTVSGTALTITFDMPLRIGPVADNINYYLQTGNVIAAWYTLVIPHPTEDVETCTHKMIIADAGLNGELGLAASVNVRLIEAW